MSLRNRERTRTDEKGLPPLPDTMGRDLKDTDSGSGHWSVRSRFSTKEGKGKERQGPNLPSAISIFTEFKPSSTPSSPLAATHSSPAALSSRSPFASASASNLFDRPPPSPQSFRQYPGGPLAPPSPSVSQRSILSATPKSTAGKRSMFNTRSSSRAAPSVRSNHTMPDLVGYNDMDQWGVGTAGPGPRTPTSPKKGSNTPPEVGIRRKNSSSKMLAKGLSRGLTRMGSVMKRSTSGARGLASDENQNRRMRNRHSVVHEEMGEEWERVDLQKEVTEGDVSITRPFNVEHNLHVSPDLDNLPPAWLEALKAQGLSEEDLLLIASARQRAGQVPMLRIVKGSLPPSSHEDATTPTTFSQARSRGLSTPAHLMINPSPDTPVETPLLDKRFSWERSPTTPSGTTSTNVETPSTPLSAFRQSLQKPLSPAIPRPVNHTPPRRHYTSDYRAYEAAKVEHDEEAGQTEETPKKTKRWSDQLRGFQSSLAGLGTDDDWGSSLTSALYGGTDTGLQTVHESESGGRESIDSITSSRGENEDQPPESNSSSPVSPPVLGSSPSSSTWIEKDMKILAISPTLSAGSRPCLSPPGSPSTPRGSRMRRKPVPSATSPLGSPTNRRHSTRSTRSTKSAGTPQAERQWPTSPSVAPSSDPHHVRSRSIGQSHFNDSELDHELRTPSTNDHFPLSKPKSSDSLLPPLPRSISEESQWTLALAQTSKPAVEIAHPWHQFGFRNDDSPPRPDPRLSLPATAGYTESSPPSRCHTPIQSDTEHLPAQELLPSTSNTLPAPAPAPGPPPSAKRPISSPRSPPSSSPRSSNTSPRYRKHRDKDPMSRLDNANPSERASIALSMISLNSDVRSSVGSLKSTYQHEAKVLRAYMRDPAEHGLGGLRESDAERESSTTSASEMDGSGSEGHSHGLAQAAVIRSTGDGPARTHRSRLSDDFDRKHVKSNSQSTSTSRKSASKKSHKSSIDSTRSRRSRDKEREVPTSPHPFAYQPEEYEDKEDDAMLALDDAAREVARQRGRYILGSSRAGSGRGSGSGRERFDDAEVWVGMST